MVTKAELLRKIQEHSARLVEFDVEQLLLFGSTARDDATPSSDIDLLVEFRGKPTFRNFMGLKEFLEETIGQKVDLVTRGALRESLLRKIELEALRVA